MSFLNERSLSALAAPPDPATERQVARIQARASHESIIAAMLFDVVVCLAVLPVLLPRLPTAYLLGWVAVRLLMAVVRIGYSWRVLARWREDAGGSLASYRLMSVLDGVAWGALGWGLTPVMDLEVAVVTISMLIAVSAMSALLMHVDLRACITFFVPVILPNSFYALTRGDDLGLFCCLATLGFMGVLIVASVRANMRLAELVRLRLSQERTLAAQAQALAQAQMLNQTRSRFLATMSHEMRTPLHGILGLVRLLKPRAPDAQASQQLDLIRSSGEHLVQVIDGVLDFSRMESGSLPVHAKRFALAPLIDDVAETTRVLAQEKGLKLEVRSNVQPGQTLVADPLRIRQVLLNLLGNALKFTAQGQVRLVADLRPELSSLMLAVEDSGIGIALADQQRIFEAFQQAEGTYERRFGGTGLGLTISRELCRAMGGELSCHSEPGQGAVFTFTLPLTEPVQMDEARNTTNHLPLADLPLKAWALSPLPGAAEGVTQVLLVEDNAVNAMVAEAELQRLGLKVRVVDNGRDALSWLASHTADLVLMDCEMPVMDGIETTRLLREQELALGRQRVPVIALTANGRDAFVDRGKTAGMDDYLAKPFQSHELANMVARHVALGAETAACPA